jgi:hypothetical protein
MRLAVSALLLLLSAGCSDRTTGPLTMAGTYQLIDVNGYGMPGVLTNQPENNYVATATGGALTLNRDSTFYNRIDLTEVTNGVTSKRSVVCTGRYVPDRSDITFYIVESSCPSGVRGSWDYGNVVYVDYTLFQRTRYRR